MPTEEESTDKALELVEEIVQRFRPIEQLLTLCGRQIQECRASLCADGLK